MSTKKSEYCNRKSLNNLVQVSREFSKLRPLQSNIPNITPIFEYFLLRPYHTITKFTIKHLQSFYIIITHMYSSPFYIFRNENIWWKSWYSAAKSKVGSRIFYFNIHIHSVFAPYFAGSLTLFIDN